MTKQPLPVMTTDKIRFGCHFETLVESRVMVGIGQGGGGFYHDGGDGVLGSGVAVASTPTR